MKRITATVLAVCLLVITGIVSVNAGEKLKYDKVYVAGIKVTTANMNDVLGDGGSVRFDNNSGVLTLDNAKITVDDNYAISTLHANSMDAYYLIYTTMSTLEIRLKGENSLVFETDVRTHPCYGIYSAGSIKITEYDNSETGFAGLDIDIKCYTGTATGIDCSELTVSADKVNIWSTARAAGGYGFSDRVKSLNIYYGEHIFRCKNVFGSLKDNGDYQISYPADYLIRSGKNSDGSDAATVTLSGSTSVYRKSGFSGFLNKGYIEFVPHKGHKAQKKVDSVPASCTDAGCKEYYVCRCGVCFEDTGCTVKISDSASWKKEGGNGFIAPIGHDWSGKNGICKNDSSHICLHEDYKSGVCTVCGKTAPPIGSICNIHLDPMGGTVSATDIPAWYGKKIPALPVPVLEHYKFVGWGKLRRGRISLINTEANWYSGNVTLYAQYKPADGEGVYVIFDANGGSGAPATIHRDAACEITVPNDRPVKEGFCFLGWGTDVNSTEVSVKPGDKYKAESTVTFYAVWAERHSWNGGEETIKATCKAAGEKLFACEKCGAKKTEQIEKLTVHSWNSGVVTKTPTADEEGEKTYTCTVCGAKTKEKLGKLEQENEKQENAFRPGDVDGDGDVDVSDARFALRAAIRLTDSGLDFTDITKREFLAADTDGDKKIDVNDARNILRVAIRLDSPENWKK